jgi:hypothetical protein
VDGERRVDESCSARANDSSQQCAFRICQRQGSSSVDDTLPSAGFPRRGDGRLHGLPSPFSRAWRVRATSGWGPRFEIHGRVSYARARDRCLASGLAETSQFVDRASKTLTLVACACCERQPKGRALGFHRIAACCAMEDLHGVSARSPWLSRHPIRALGLYHWPDSCSEVVANVRNANGN